MENFTPEKIKTEYERWRTNLPKGSQLMGELCDMESDPDEVADAFYRSLEFGTSGLRGIIGPGTNRMNEFVIARATGGLAAYLKEIYTDPSVIIAYDSRKNSDAFAVKAARILSGAGIRVKLFPQIAPVSMLSYAITHLSASLGVMITASHNPKIFNGYKVYNENGYQIVGSEAKAIYREIVKLDYFDSFSENEEYIEEVDDKLISGFTEKIASMADPSMKPFLNDLSVVYTPLNGTGYRYVSRVFDLIGFQHYVTVPNQKNPDPEFTTCNVPNPEKITAFAEAFKLADEIGADIALATDPDSDRVGVAVSHLGMKVLLTGNQLGVLFLDYLCQTRTVRDGQIVIKSIVTTPLTDRIAEKYGLRVVNTLTGFKYIGEAITAMEKENRLEDYFFGYEESNGYLIDPFIRDKDGVSAVMLTVEMAAYYKFRGMTLMDRLYELYSEYGTCMDKTKNYFFEGPSGGIVMSAIMQYFRDDVNDKIDKSRISRKTDYLDAPDGLPPENAIRFDMENGTVLIIRPSGTEAKIKTYLFETGPSSALEKEIARIIGQFKADIV